MCISYTVGSQLLSAATITHKSNPSRKARNVTTPLAGAVTGVLIFGSAEEVFFRKFL